MSSSLSTGLLKVDLFCSWFDELTTSENVPSVGRT